MQNFGGLKRCIMGFVQVENSVIFFSRILGEQRRKRGEREARVARESALPLARDSRFELASLLPLFT